MGQTLTYGVYLPDEGERNCYSGLAQNWQILDDAVGAIAGKANASHTHGNITNDGAIGSTSGLPIITGTNGVLTTGTFGSTEGTFCEGNDSRLSDARTPLSHTHGNITNDGKVGTTANKPLITGTGGAVQAGSFGNSANTFCEGNDSRLSDARTPVAHTHTKSDVTDLLNSNFIPSANNSYDLGSSSYQWNNLYAKNYYYNGVAWGLDKANVWTNEQTYSTYNYGQMIWLKNTGLDLSVNGNTGLSETYQHMINWADKNNTSYSAIQSWTNNAENVLVLRSRYRTDANTVRTSSIRNQCTATAKRWYPEGDADTDLGISSNRWKTLNGVNPGALSLPDMGNVANTNYFDFSGSITHLDGADNFYTPTVDGWMTVIIAGTSLSLFVDAATNLVQNQGVGISAAPANGFCLATIPVRKSIRVKIQATGTSIYMAFVRPNLGNV